MRATQFLSGMVTLGVDLFTGVPDSLLKPLCDALYTRYGCSGQHVVAANEGGAVALAAGHYIATGKPALCYLQNSGIGNSVNPIASLLDERVYGIPCIFVVGWRGEPGVKDEPQHTFQGLITKELLTLMNLTVLELTKDTHADDFINMLTEAKPLLESGKSVVFLVHKDGLTGDTQACFEERGNLSRENALRELLAQSCETDIFVSTTGKASREVFELREALGQGHAHDFLTVGSMGHANMIALGIAKAKPDFTIWVLDGDGAALMHLGGLLVEAHEHATNLIHVVLNNGAHESVGGMPVVGGSFWFAPLARAIGYEQCFTAESANELRGLLPRLRASSRSKLTFLEILLKQGSREDLGRPTETPKQNLQALMQLLGSAN